MYLAPMVWGSAFWVYGSVLGIAEFQGKELRLWGHRMDRVGWEVSETQKHVE